MMLPRLLTASALLLAPCLMVGCSEDEPVSEPSVGGVTPADHTADADADVHDHDHADGEAHTEGEDDPDVERASEELDDEADEV